MGINFKDLKDNAGNDDFSPVPTGRYNLAIESGEKGVSKTGNDKIEFTLKIIEGDHKNRKLWQTFSLLPQAQIYLLNFLKAAGSDVIDRDGEVSTQEIIQDAVGKNVSAYVEITNGNNGKPRNQIDGNSFKPYESQETAPKSGSSNSGSSNNSGGDNGEDKKEKLFS